MTNINVNYVIIAEVADDVQENLFPSKKKAVLLADAGIVLNTPYPLALRPERRCDVIISFDFSSREKDDMNPFEVGFYS